MNPTRSLVLSGTASVAASLAAYGALRLFGTGAAAACVRTCACAAVIFLACAALARLRAGAFTASASAAVVGAGATAICALFAASRSADMFGLLLAGFVMGIALSIFALMKDLDEQTSPRLLLFLPIAQLIVLLTVFGL
ncbi:MAG: hypothetical protein RL272_846 [Candidatus Parcubacteria bacterium]|jgi:flagellar biosynthesis protein FliQ